MPERVKRSYLFSVGDAGDDPVGFAIRVEALNPEAALDLVCEKLPDQADVSDKLRGRLDDVVYAEVYVNARKITLDHLFGQAECTECEVWLTEDQDRCPYEHEHPEVDP
jgi:hypothetical protein